MDNSAPENTNTQAASQQPVSPVVQVPPPPQPVQNINPQPAVNPVNAPKSSNFKILPIIALAIIIVLGVLFLITKQKKTSNISTSPINRTTGNPTPTPEIITPTVIDASDEQLDTDLQSIESELNNIDNNLNNVDSGLNDKQTNLN